MSDTGGGHRASANALRDALQTLYPQNSITCDIVDIYTDYGPFFPFDSFVPIYQFLQANPFLWEIGFWFAASPFGLAYNRLVLEVCCGKGFKECLGRSVVEGGSGDDGKRADMVVSVHPLTQDVPLKVLRELDKEEERGEKTPFVTVVTDLGSAHPTWFNPDVDRIFVPSDALRRIALDRGFSPDQITQHGLPIRKGFWGESSINSNNSVKAMAGAKSNFFDDLAQLFQGGKATTTSTKTITKATITETKSGMRTKLGLSDVPTVLIVGGGDGMGGIVPQARAVATRLKDASVEEGRLYQMVVVCGKNVDARDTLRSVNWDEDEGLEVKVEGFVNNMDEFMRASDVIVTKAGPGTIAEASICGLPCMLSSFLPGQEEGNIPFVKDAGFGSYSKDPKKIAEVVEGWLSDPDYLSEMRENALKAARPTATIDIARDLAEILYKT